MLKPEKPYIYLAGDIMSFGSNLARQYEYDKFNEAGINAEVYSPVMNKSINDKANMTEEENNKLAEKITQQDIDRMWKSDIVSMCPEQSAIGSLCEMGCLYGWKYVASVMRNTADTIFNTIDKTKPSEESIRDFEHKLANAFLALLYHMEDKEIYAHYFDIRTNHLNEKDWRRSFSINQLLYGMILGATQDRQLHNSFDEVLPIIKKVIDEANEVRKGQEEND